MIRVLSSVSRAALAIVVFLVVLAVLRWRPVHAEPPWDVRALPLYAPAIVLGIAAALTARSRRRRWPVAPLGWSLVAAVAVLATTVGLRSGGLSAAASTPQGSTYTLPPGAIDVTGQDLRRLPPGRHWTLVWTGPLRAPASGRYRLWAVGSGRLRVEVDGQVLLHAEGESFDAGAEIPLGQGSHALAVTLEQRGPGLGLRLGWVRPKRDGSPGGASDVVSPRYLGMPGSWLPWALTDVLAVLVAALVAALALAIPWDQWRRPREGAAVTAGEIMVSACGYVVLVAALSWPLVRDLGAFGPVDRVDGRLNAWILAWDASALLHRPLAVFQAPIFHPLPDSLAFTENLLLPAALMTPLTLVGGPMLAYNLLLFASAILSGIGTQLLVRRVTADRLAAFVAGAAFAVGGHRWVRMAHLHVELTWLLPFALLALDRFWERRELGRALVLGVVLALQGWSSVYVGAMTATVVAVGATLMLPLLRPVEIARLGAGLALAALLLAPVARPYLRMRAFEGMEFTLRDQAVYATTPESYAAGAGRIYAELTRRHLDGARVRDPLFPGLALLVLGLAGVAAAPRRYRLVGLSAALVAVWISLGPETAAYRFLHDHVVFFHGIRALGRFSLVAILALSVFAGLALAGCRRRLVWAALAALVVESANVPARHGIWEPPTVAAHWLAGRPGAVAYLPLGQDDTRAMLQSTAHFRPLVNGDSGFVPRAYARATELLSGPGVSADGLRLLRALDVRDVVAPPGFPLPLLRRFGGESVYGVPPGETALPADPGTPVSTLWGRDGVTVDLGDARDVSAVFFEIDDRPWVEAPRVAVSIDGERWEGVRSEASLARAVLSLCRDPRHGLGVVQTAATRARFVRIDPALPARPGALWVSP